MRVGWLTKLVKIRWLPYVALSVAAGMTAVFGWGYLKGYDKAETVYQEAMNKALKEQYERVVALHKKDTANLVRTQTKKEGVKNALKVIPRPADGCTVSDECLQLFNNGVRIFNSSTKGVDD